MYYVIFTTDKPDSLALRTATRPAHIEYLGSHSHPVKLLHGGPTLSDADNTMNGTLIIAEAESITAVEKLVAGDPYVKVGLFEELHIRPWDWALGKPEN